MSIHSWLKVLLPAESIALWRAYPGPVASPPAASFPPARSTVAQVSSEHWANRSHSVRTVQGWTGTSSQTLASAASSPLPPAKISSSALAGRAPAERGCTRRQLQRGAPARYREFESLRPPPGAVPHTRAMLQVQIGGRILGCTRGVRHGIRDGLGWAMTGAAAQRPLSSPGLLRTPPASGRRAPNASAGDCTPPR